MRIAGYERHTMLQTQRANPDIVFRDRFATFPQTRPNLRIDTRCFQINFQHIGFGNELIK